MSRQEEIRLVAKATSGDPVAQAEIVALVAPVVRKVAKTFYGADYMDFFQAGMEGALVAINKYDPARGASFTTYAVQWVQAYMMRIAVTSRSIVHFALTTKNIEERVHNEDISLEGRYGTEGDLTWGDVLADGVDIEQIAIRNECEYRLSRAIAITSMTMTERGKDILHRRILADEPMTVAALGKKWGCSAMMICKDAKGIVDKLRRIVEA